MTTVVEVLGRSGAPVVEVVGQAGTTVIEAQVRGLRGEPGGPGEDGIIGVDGASAYEIAVAHGFTGTEVEWLASFVTNVTNEAATRLAADNALSSRVGAVETTLPTKANLTDLSAAVAALVGSAPSTLDTLGEISTALAADESAAAALAAQVGTKAAQSSLDTLTARVTANEAAISGALHPFLLIGV